MPSAHSFIHRRSFLVPQVYIHPPPEDSLPPYCFFSGDAVHDSDSVFEREQAAAVSPWEADAELRDSLDNGDLPVFNRDSIEQVIMPRKRFEDDDDYEDYGQDITIRGEAPAADFSEVIEVIKVSRKPFSTPVPAPMKRSDTFISRAFRSIKNVNRVVASRSKKSEQKSPENDSPVPAPTTPSTVSSATSVTTFQSSESTPRPRRFSRRSSVNLVQLFTRPSSPSAESVSPPSSESAPARSPTPKLTRLRHSYSTISTQSPLEDDADSIDAQSIDRSASPTPSTSTFAVKKRFSVLNLFNRHPTTSALNTADSQPAIIKMKSSDSLGPFSSNCSGSSKSSSASSAGPFTPTEPAASFDSGVAFDPAVPFDHPAFSTPVVDSAPPPLPPKGSTLLKKIPSLVKKGSNLKTTGRPVPDCQIEERESERLEADISLEMRLDSLHFDELSFDVDNF